MNKPLTPVPLIAIIGRPNVGKSSLFNRILRRRIAIVHEQSGVTRDRIAAPVTHDGRHFLLVDTGGLGVFPDEKATDSFDACIRSQIEAVIRDAHKIIWMVDAKSGLTPLDREIGRFLRESGCRLVAVANKTDNPEMDSSVLAEFSSVGTSVLPVSCTQNRGIGQLLDDCVKDLPAESAPAHLNKEGLKLAVIGRPNVGKSSLVNRLLGEDRVIVSDIPGTTRDAVDIPVEILAGEERIPVTLIDTAGVRRRRQVDNVVELFSVMRAENAIKRCDIAILTLDATKPATSQDRRIARLIADARKPCVIAANKWDLASKNVKLKELRNRLHTEMAFMEYAPIVGVCALSGYQVNELIKEILTVFSQMEVAVPTSLLNQFLEDTVTRQPPPAKGGRALKLYYATMTHRTPPRFVLFVNHKTLCTQTYLNFLENRIRKAFYPDGGVPVTIELRARKRPELKGSRSAISGVMKKKTASQDAVKRHHERRKGYRKKR